jgi:hypothetical protein
MAGSAVGITTDKRAPGFWMQVIEEGLRSNGGAARTVQVVAWIETHIELTAPERVPTSHGKSPSFHLVVKDEMHKLSQDGRLRRPRPGVFALP